MKHISDCVWTASFIFVYVANIVIIIVYRGSNSNHTYCLQIEEVYCYMLGVTSKVVVLPLSADIKCFKVGFPHALRVFWFVNLFIVSCNNNAG